MWSSTRNKIVLWRGLFIVSGSGYCHEYITPRTDNCIDNGRNLPWLWNRRFLHVCDRSGFLQGTRTGENLCWSYRRNKGLVAALRQMKRTSQGKQLPPTPHPDSWVFTTGWLSTSFFLSLFFLGGGGCVVRPDGLQIECISPEKSDWSWDSVLTYIWSGVRISAREIIFPSPKLPDWLWDPPSLLVSGYGYSVLGTKRPGSDVDSSPSSSAEFKSEWIYTASPPVLFAQRQIYPFWRTTFSL